MKTRLFDSHRIILLAGWLFADLLLALSMIFLVNTPPRPREITPTHQVTQVLTVTPTLSISGNLIIDKTRKTATSTTQPKLTQPRPTQTPQIGLDLQSVKIVVQVDTDAFLNDDSYQLKNFKSKIDDALSEYKNRRAGLVITLGHHGTISTGIKLATRANALLAEYFPKIFSGVISKPFWWNLDEIHTAGTIQFEIYFYNR